MNQSKASLMIPTAGQASLAQVMQPKASFTPNATGYCHEHNHRNIPHMHTPLCERFVSGIDKNRQSRYYFTHMITPIRVYLNYNEKLNPAPSVEPNQAHSYGEQINPMLNGRKLSPKTLRSQLRINPQFIDEAKNFIFVKDSMSLVPTLPVINLTAGNNSLTMAEMAVQPLHLPPITQQHHKTKTNVSSRLTSKSRKLTESSSVFSTSNIGNIASTDRTIDEAINE